MPFALTAPDSARNPDFRFFEKAGPSELPGSRVEAAFRFAAKPGAHGAGPRGRARQGLLSKYGLSRPAAVLACAAFLSGLSPLTADAAGEDGKRTGNKTAASRSPAISDAWARATVPGQDVGAAFMTIDSPVDVRLIGIESDVARTAEIHSMRHQNGVMQMRAQKQVGVPAGQRVELVRGGTHLMLLGLKKPLKAGEEFQLKLTFADSAGARMIVPVSVPVRPFGQ